MTAAEARQLAELSKQKVIAEERERARKYEEYKQEEAKKGQDRLDQIFNERIKEIDLLIKDAVTYTLNNYVIVTVKYDDDKDRIFRHYSQQPNCYHFSILKELRSDIYLTAYGWPGADFSYYEDVYKIAW